MDSFTPMQNISWHAFKKVYCTFKCC